MLMPKRDPVRASMVVEITDEQQEKVGKEI
jgi:hypothetical protein